MFFKILFNVWLMWMLLFVYGGLLWSINGVLFLFFFKILVYKLFFFYFFLNKGFLVVRFVCILKLVFGMFSVFL